LGSFPNINPLLGFPELVIPSWPDQRVTLGRGFPSGESFWDPLGRFKEFGRGRVWGNLSLSFFIFPLGGVTFSNPSLWGGYWNHHWKRLGIGLGGRIGEKFRKKAKNFKFRPKVFYIPLPQGKKGFLNFGSRKLGGRKITVGFFGPFFYLFGGTMGGGF